MEARLQAAGAPAVTRTINVLAVIRTRAAGEALRELGARLDGARLAVHVGRLAELGGGLPAERDPDVLLLEVDPREAGEMARAEAALRAHFAAVPVIATAPEVGPQDLGRLLRLGAVDFVAQPINRRELAGALERAARMRREAGAPAEPPGRVVAYLKAGGGAGATTLAVQSGCLLAARAAGRGEVCLIDLDVQFGSAALHLDLDGRVGLGDLIEAPERLDAELLRSVMGHHESGLDVLAAPREVLALDSVTPAFVAGCLDLARHTYQTVLLDLPGTWTAWSHAAARACDLIVLVAQLSVPGVRHAERQLQALRAQGLDEVPVCLVLNRHHKGWGERARLKEAERALGRRFDVLVADDARTVGEAIERGVPVARVKRRSQVETGLARLLDATGAAEPGRLAQRG